MPGEPREANLAEYGPAVGAGPVFGVGLGEDAVLEYNRETGGGKVLWIVDPAYAGPALVRGRRLASPGTSIEFSGASPATELQLSRFEGLEPGEWLNVPSTVFVNGPGCYAFQVDSLTYTDLIVFRASPS